MLHWLVEATAQLRAFPAYFLCNLYPSSCNSMNCTPCCERAKPVKSVKTRPWLPGAFTILGMDRDGPHEQAPPGYRGGLPLLWRWPSASCITVTGVLAPGCVPLFLTDGFKDCAAIA